MQSLRRSRLIWGILPVLILAAGLGLSIFYGPSPTLVQPGQQHLVERAERDAAAIFRHSPRDQRRITFPIVLELSDRTCVELRSTAADAGGNYLACYSASGELIGERAATGF